jgi:endonuclease III
MNDYQSRQNELTALLLQNRNGGEDWGDLSHLNGTPCSKQQANKFLLCCLLDWQMKADVAWANGYRLVEDILGNPDDLWQAITSLSESEWKSKRPEYKLHRFRAGHDRLWKIAKCISDRYDGDARRIWEGQDAKSVLNNLWALGAGDQLSRMIVGALKDCGLVSGPSDVKADVYVCRVLGRALEGQEVDPKNADRAIALAQQLYPADPWQLDWALWYFGEAHCHLTSPECSTCSLAPCCTYAEARSRR